MNKAIIIIIGLTVLVASCASKKEQLVANFSKVELDSVCPEDGKCTITLIENKSIVLNTDEFGSMFYNMNNDNSKNLLIYKYDRNVPEGLQDGSYREEVIIELDKKTGLPTQSKRIFGRFCFCKGQTGYYKINEEITNERIGDKNIYRLQFKINQVPQIITNLNFSLY